MSNRENENIIKRKDFEQKYSTAESEITSLKNDLRLALQRIADLQQAMEEGDDDDDDASSDRYEVFVVAVVVAHFSYCFNFNFSDMSESSEDSVCDQTTILTRRNIQITTSNTNGILDRKLIIREDEDEIHSPRYKQSLFSFVQ